MLSSESPTWQHALQDIALILSSLVCLPFSAVILVISYILRPYVYLRMVLHRRSLRASADFRPRTILVTGVGMTKGLFLARTFYSQGHDVIGADFEPYCIPVCGRFSASLKRFYRLSAPTEQYGSSLYADSLLRIVRLEKVDMWISCSGVASAVSDGQARDVLSKRSDCVCIQFDAASTEILHEKDTFIAATEQLGLPIPETHNVTTRDGVHKVLHQVNASPKREKRKSYIMKPVGVDDKSRGNIRTLLPRRTLSQTYDHVARVDMSPGKKWVLQEFVKGKEYCTHALVIRGVVKAFVACPSSDMVMHYEILPPDGALSQAMLRFTEKFADQFSPPDDAPTKGEKITGHLSFDFLVDEAVTEKGAEWAILPIECNPRAHTAVALFAGKEREMTEAYLSLLDNSTIKSTPADNPQALSRLQNISQTRLQPNVREAMVTPNPTMKVYWIGHDFITYLLEPLPALFTSLFTSKSHIESQSQNEASHIPTATQYHSSIHTFIHHITLWHDGTYELWDPLPAFWLYHVYWPIRLLSILYEMARFPGEGRWSKVNISTGKVFGC